MDELLKHIDSYDVTEEVKSLIKIMNTQVIHNHKLSLLKYVEDIVISSFGFTIDYRLNKNYLVNYVNDFADVVYNIMLEWENVDTANYFKNLVLTLKDYFIIPLRYITKLEKDKLDIHFYHVNSNSDNSNLKYILKVGYIEKRKNKYIKPDINHPATYYNFNNAYLIFTTITKSNNILEFKKFIGILIKIVRDVKYNIGTKDNINVGFLLMEYTVIHPYLEVMDDLVALANKIPRNNLVYFDGWKENSLIGRILKNVEYC